MRLVLPLFEGESGQASPEAPPLCYGATMNQHAKRRYQASLAALPVEPDEDTPQAPARTLAPASLASLPSTRT